MTRAPHSAVAIDAALERGDAALIAYLPVGFPSVEDSIRAGKVLADAGVDVIELGFPYSDPGMDGPTIQRASVAALERGTHLEDLFHAVDELTSYGISTTSMTYWNPVEWWGVERFAKDFAAVGGSGLITPDLPPEEGAQWEAASDKYDLERIYLTAPSSPEHRLKLIAEHSRGWVYAASSMGVTAPERPSARTFRTSSHARVRLVPSACAWAWACPTAPRRKRSAPTRTASSSARRWSRPSSMTTSTAVCGRSASSPASSRPA